MKYLNKMLFATIFFLFLILWGSNAVAQNSISGIVFDHNRKPVSDIFIELLDDVERQIASRKTQNGFYTFQRLARGIYFLRVRTDGTNLKETKIRIDLGDLNSIGGVDVKQRDIFLKLDKKRTGNLDSVTGVVFVQEIPIEAEKAYNTGVQHIKKKRTKKAIISLKEAIRIFPEYFEALAKLGSVFLDERNFVEAENLLLRALKVNRKSFRTAFDLAIAQNKQNKFEDAAKSLKSANQIDSGSINAHLLEGIILRKLKKLDDAKRSLLKAKALSKNKQAEVNWQLAELYYFDLKTPNKAADELEFYLRNLTREERKTYSKKIPGIKKLIKNLRKESSERS